MNGRRAIVGLCMLCALMVSAFAAQSASASTTHWGTTAVTCKKGAGDTGGATFNEAHCKPGSPSGEWGHYEIKSNTTTTLTGNDNGEGTKLKTTIGGLGVTLSSTSLEGTGWMENKTVGGAHVAHGKGTIIYKGVTVSVPKCFVYTDDGTGTPGTQGVVDTVELTATTEGQTETDMFLNFKPAEGEVFARFWILDKNKVGTGGECTVPGTYTVNGSVKGRPNGATTVFTHTDTTTQNTLKMGIGGGAGFKAGIEGSLTIEGKHPGIEGDTYKPISTTTYNTVTA